MRERILAAAAELFVRNGYAGTSVREIALALGISNPSLYHHFSSKDELFAELLRAPLDILETTVRESNRLRGEARATRLLGGLLHAMEVHSGIVMTTLRDADQLPDARRELLQATQPVIVELLSKSAARDHRELRVQMTIAAVQGAVMNLFQSSNDANVFVQRLRAETDAIVAIAIKILRQ